MIGSTTPSVAEAAADAILAEHGEPKSREALRAMLAFAFTSGARAGMSDAVEQFDRVLAKHKSA